MCSVGRSINVGALKAMPHDRSNTTGAPKTGDGRFGPEKDAPTGALRPSTPQVRGDCFTDVCRKRQFATPATLATNCQLPPVPVDVINIESRDFTGAQTESGKQKQDGVIATSHRRIPINTGQQFLNLVCRNRPGNR